MSTPDFAKLVPGFDFLQNLMKGAGASLPGMSQWIAPTLDAEEVDKRIQELRTVQYWLEQNARMLGATIQALEVQRMTLATLRTMNLPMNELRESMKLDPAAYMPKADAPATAAAPAPAPSPAPAWAEAPAPAAEAPAAPPAVDPLQWWGALTRQFAELAANAVKDAPAEAAPAPQPAPRRAPAKKAPAKKAGARRPAAKPAPRAR